MAITNDGLAREGEVLVLHASVGGGHRAAARAVARAIDELDPARPVRVVDALDGVAPAARSLYLRSFELSVAHLPGAYGTFFELTRDIDLSPVWRAGRRLANRTQGSALHALLRQARPAAVVCTHFLPLEVALREQARDRLDAPVFSVVTDYVAHGFWRQPRAELTFCPPGRARRDLLRGGVPARRIVPCGIPVDPSCAAPWDGAELRARLGLPLDRPAVALLAGGAGMGPLVEVLQATARELGDRAELVVVCGSNQLLRAEAERAARALPGARVRVLGYVDPLLDLLRAVDLVVTKPGGLTTSECLALGKATVFYEAAPGQEGWNARFAQARGAALVGRTPQEAARAAAHVLADPELRRRLGERARLAGRPHAAKTVAAQVLLRARRPACTTAA